MRIIPLAALALLAAGCVGSGTSLTAGPRVQQTTTDIETASGGVYTVSQMVERNVSSSEVNLTPEEAWKALPDVYRALEIPVTMVDSRTRMLGTTENRLSRIATHRPSRYLDCGRGLAGQYANIYHVFVTLITQVEPTEDGGTAVHTQLQGAARDPAHGNNPVRCVSTGVLEMEIARALQDRQGASLR